MPAPNVSQVDGRNGWVYPDVGRATYQNSGKGHFDLRQVAIARGWAIFGSEYLFGWFPVDDAFAGQAPDLLLGRDASGTLFQRNGNARQCARRYTADSVFQESGSNAETLVVKAAPYTDSVASLLPSDAILEAVVVRVNQTIPGAETFALGDTETPTRFGANIPATAGTTRVCVVSGTQTTAAKLRVTPNVTPTSATASVQLAAFYRLFCAAGTWLIVFGDSKSDTGNSWHTTLATKFQDARGIPLAYSIAAQAGRGIVNAAPSIVGFLSPINVNTDYPTVICNLGVNDFVGMPSQATIETAYLTIVDAMKAKWPNVRVWLMRPWKQGYDAAADTMATYIGNVQSSRSSFVSLGPDERVFLRGSDNGASETTDGIHPSALGQTLYANEWFALPIFAT